MTARMIPINTCFDCPHRDHQGAFGKVAYVPVCGKKNRKLPYNVTTGPIGQQANPTGNIPAWCPLEKRQ